VVCSLHREVERSVCSSPEDIGVSYVVRVSHGGASWVCYFRALQIGDAAKVAPVDKLSVVLVAIFAVIFLGERPAAKDWLGIILVGGGVILLGLKK
jgi:uncharacterized membrane protein